MRRAQVRERNNPFTRNDTRSELKSIFGIFLITRIKPFFPRLNSLISNFERDTITYENRTDEEFSLYKSSLKFFNISILR